MLFNSPEFIFGFVPIVLVVFYLLARQGQRAALAWLALASLWFYGWWNPFWVPLLLVSIALNLAVGMILLRLAEVVEPARPSRSHLEAIPGAGDRQRLRRGLLFLAISANVGLLVHYKYADFAWGAIATLLGHAHTPSPLELPLGISFFTFTQIAFLVDLYRQREADLDPLRYGLFVTYYPHLIAGPILHHRELMPQFMDPSIYRFDAERLAQGLSIFTLGLFKKTVLADQFATYSTPAFHAATTGALTFFEAWSAALSYTFQLYFDFSGYSDMAIGLALMIGIRLPINFDSPYKARSIADFWRRWHITLSRFLRDYLYIPLGGNRRGAWRRYGNLFITMLLGGIWHGAGWTFVLWGAWHGALLVLHQVWRERLLPRMPKGLRATPGTQILAWMLTFLVVVVGWVFFRAADPGAAWTVLRGMAGQSGSVLPDQLIQALPPLGYLADPVGKVPHLGDGSVMGAVEVAFMLGLGGVLVLAAPPLHRLSPRVRLWLVLPCAALALQRVLYGTASEFLYFQF